MDERLKRIVTEHRFKTFHVSDRTPNGDLLVDFLGRAAWQALCVELGNDFERLQAVLTVAMRTWNLSVMRAQGRMPDSDVIRDFLERNGRFFEVYSARKEALFAGDERFFVDVMIRPGEDGEPEVNALATVDNLDGHAPSTPRALPPPRARTERNRARRARRRG